MSQQQGQQQGLNKSYLNVDSDIEQSKFSEKVVEEESHNDFFKVDQQNRSQYDDLKFTMKYEDSYLGESHIQETPNNINSIFQNEEVQQRPSGREVFLSSKKFGENEKVVIYKDEFKDKLMLSPIKKYAKYGNFPFKLLIHIGLIIFTSLQIEYTHSQFTPFSRMQDLQWLSLFYNDTSVESNNGIYTFYSIGEFQNHIKDLFINLSQFNQKYFQQINLEKSNIFLEYSPEPIKTQDLSINFQDYPIDPYKGIVQPFDQNDKISIKKFLGQTRNFNIKINNLSVSLAQENQPYSCWNFALQYKFVATVYIQSILQADGKKCSEHNKSSHKIQEATILFKGSQYIINLVILILSAASFFLGVKYIFDMIKDYMYFKKKGQILVPTVNQQKSKKNKNDEDYLPENLIKILHEQRPWDELTFSEKRKYFDMWFIVILVGNLCQIASSLFIMFQVSQDNLVSRISEPFRWLQGLGCTLAWLSVLKYFEYFSKFNITSEIIRYSFPKIGMHVIGFVPILASFIIIGMTAFGASQRFATLRDSFASLFSLLLGDSIGTITHDISNNGISRPLAILYIVSFIILFILSVNNIMIAIIQGEGQRRREMIKRDNAYRKMEKFQKKQDKIRKIEEKKLLNLFNSGENLDSLEQSKVNPQDQGSKGQKSKFAHSSQIRSSSSSELPDEKNEYHFNESQLSRSDNREYKQDPELMINRSRQDSMLSSQSGKEKYSKKSSIITSEQQHQQFIQQSINQQQSHLASQNQQQNQLDPVLEDMRESLAYHQLEEYQNQREKSLILESQASKQDQDANKTFINQNKQESSEPTQSVQKSSILSSSSNKSQSLIDQNQKTKISIKALTRVAIQMKKQKQTAQQKLDLKDQFTKEVELLTEQKINYRELYKMFKRSFNQLTEIIDKQSYEIKDNLYLYKISKEDKVEIIKKYCDILVYFSIRARVQ